MKSDKPYFECSKCGHEMWAFEDAYICSNLDCDNVIEFD